MNTGNRDPLYFEAKHLSRVEMSPFALQFYASLQLLTMQFRQGCELLSTIRMDGNYII